MVTVYQQPHELARMIAAFRSNGGADKPVYVQVHLSWAPDEDEALAIAYDQWRTNILPSPLMAEIAHVEQFDLAATHVRPDDMRSAVLVSSDPGRFVAWLQDLFGLGVDAAYLHHVGKSQHSFIETFGEKVLPGVST